MISIRSQILRIVGFSLLIVAIVSVACFELDSYFAQKETLRLEGRKLLLSSASQGALLITGMLVREEFGSIPLHLEKIKQAENLSGCAIATEPELNKALKELPCSSLTEGWLCISAWNGRVSTFTRLKLLDRTLGYLNKTRSLSPLELAAPFSRPLLMVLIGLSLAFIIMALWVSYFLQKDVRGPLMNLKEILTPVLTGGPSVNLPNFKVSELQAVVSQVEQLVKEREQGRVNAAIAGTVQMLAHDIKRPFHLLESGLFLIENEKTSLGIERAAALIKENVRTAFDDVKNMLAEVRDIGTPSRLNTKVISLKPTIELSLNETVLDRKRYTIDCDFAHTQPVIVDTAKTKRVLVNLIENSLQAMSAGGRMWIRTRDVSENGREFVEVCIGNDHSSLSDDDRKRVFEPFFTKGKAGGTGWGLAIADKVVRDHGGRIWCPPVKNDNVEFYFTLPACDAPVSVESQLSEPIKIPAAPIEPLRICLIDDDAVCLDSMAAILQANEEKWGPFTVQTFQDPIAGLKSLESGTPDLLICDLDLGKHYQTGLQVISEIRERGNKKTYICLHSGFDLKQIGEGINSCGANAFLQKPLDPIKLDQLVTACLNYRTKEFVENEI